MKTSSKLIFFFMIIFSSMIIISSSSWFSAWMGLEINLMSFISFMLINSNSNSIESSIIYFLVQSIASILFLFSTIFYMKMFNYSFSTMNILNSLMMSALMMKIGAAPLHFWLPIIMKGMNWMNNFMLMTWQKLGPMVLIFYTLNQKLIWMFILMSMMIGSLGGFNQTSLKKIMAFSSINQISWMLISLYSSKYLWTIYYLLYFFILFNSLIMFHFLNILFLPQLMNLKLMGQMASLFIFSSIMSMGGLPPFLGFFPKMMIIMQLNNYLLMLLIILFSLITLYYYLRIIYFILLMNNLKKNNKMKFITMTNMIMKLSTFTNISLMIFILI